MEKVVAVIEGSSIGTSKLLMDALVTGGYRPLFLSRDPSRFPFFGDKNIKCIQTDTNNQIQMLEELIAYNRSSKDKIMGVTSAYDYYMPSVAYIAHSLGLPGQDVSAAKSARHKHNQKKTFASHSLPVPRFAVCSTLEEIKKAAEEFGFPVVCKPVSGAGSMGVKKFEYLEDLSKHAAYWLQQATNYRGIPIEKIMLVEEFIFAPEISIEVFNGSAIAVTDKYITKPPIFLETGHEVPSRHRPVILTKAMTLAEKAVAALNLTFGCCHVELHVRGEELFLIEVNQRIAGDLIPQLVKEAIGIDLVEAVIKSAIGERVELKRSAASKVSRIGFLLAGEISEASRAKLPMVMSCPNVVDAYMAKEIPTEVQYGDPRDRVGYVICTAKTPEECHKSLRQALQILINSNTFAAFP